MDKGVPEELPGFLPGDSNEALATGKQYFLLILLSFRTQVRQDYVVISVIQLNKHFHVGKLCSLYLPLVTEGTSLPLRYNLYTKDVPEITYQNLVHVP